jgi:hypothetical protein
MEVFMGGIARLKASSCAYSAPQARVDELMFAAQITMRFSEPNCRNGTNAVQTILRNLMIGGEPPLRVDTAVRLRPRLARSLAEWLGLLADALEARRGLAAYR